VKWLESEGIVANPEPEKVPLLGLPLYRAHSMQHLIFKDPHRFFRVPSS
jgi:hypothetical protein